ncbi:hypothetical protein [uncultured Corynebacterium sp.]|uniref:hypothetical protein n=1 Tax=uncultured Corynebacterium sp. TaxID=159447 RepID=UPI0025EC440E|nr:hypothetical protein [uncultured Corynebacterium sp.]
MNLSAGLWSIILAVCSMLCTVTALVCLCFLVFTDSDGDAVAAPASSSEDAPVIVTVTEGAGDNGGAEPTAVGDAGGSDATPDSTEPDDDLDPAFITMWAMHGMRLELFPDGTAVYHRYSGAVSLIKWSATWTATGRTVTATVGDVIDSHGELDHYPVHSAGDQITGVISADGTRMDITDPADDGRTITTCRSDVYDQICGP